MMRLKNAVSFVTDLFKSRKEKVKINGSIPGNQVFVPVPVIVLDVQGKRCDGALLKDIRSKTAAPCVSYIKTPAEIGAVNLLHKISDDARVLGRSPENIFRKNNDAFFFEHRKPFPNRRGIDGNELIPIFYVITINLEYRVNDKVFRPKNS